MTPKSELRQAHEQVQCVTGTVTRIVWWSCNGSPTGFVGRPQINQTQTSDLPISLSIKCTGNGLPRD